MRAATVTAFGGAQAVEVGEVPTPTASPGQVLIDVDYAGVVYPDLLLARGEYQFKPQPPFTLGWEVSGRVREDAGSFRAGDRVAALPVIGGFAETVAVDAHMVFSLPASIDQRVGAALSLNYLTAHLALVRRGSVEEGDTVLVHGAAGGVGGATCAVAAALGARVIAVVSTEDKAEVARTAGASDVILADGFKDQARLLTNGRGVDLVVDPVGGDRFTDSLRALAPEGRVLVVGFAGGDIPVVKTNRLLMTNTAVIGVATRELWAHEPEYALDQWDELVGLAHQGMRMPVIRQPLPLEEVRQALAALETGGLAGKQLLAVRR